MEGNEKMVKIAKVFGICAYPNRYLQYHTSVYTHYLQYHTSVYTHYLQYHTSVYTHYLQYHTSVYSYSFVIFIMSGWVDIGMGENDELGRKKHRRV